MIVVTVELHSALTGKVTLLGKAIIANDGLGSDGVGHYDVMVGRKGASDLKKIFTGSTGRIGRVENFPRKRRNVWYLLRRALTSAGY